MGKFLESLGLIDGYDIIAIGKGKAKKDELFSEILKTDKEIQNEIKKLTEKETGRIFAIVKKKKIKGIYLFEVVKKDEERILEHIKTVFTKEVKEETQNKYDEMMLKIAKDYVSSQEYNKVTFEDNVVQIDPKKSKKDIELALLGSFALAFVLGWIIFNDFMMGIIWGIIFSPTYSGLKVVITKKRGRKKKNTNKE